MGVRRLVVVNGPNIFQMLLVSVSFYIIMASAMPNPATDGQRQNDQYQITVHDEAEARSETSILQVLLICQVL